MKKLLTLALIAATAALGAGAQTAAPAGTTISNQAILDYLNPDGSAATSINSNIVTATVQSVYAVNVTPDGTISNCGQTFSGTPGNAVDIPYTVTNVGNTNDDYLLSALVETTPNSDITFYQSLGDSLIPLGSKQITNITPGSSINIVMRYTVPSDAQPGSTIHLSSVATSQGDTTVSDANNYACVSLSTTYNLTLTPATELKNTVAGSTVTFTDTLTNTGNAALSAREIVLSATNSTSLTTRYQVSAANTNPNTAGTWYATPQEALNTYLGTNTLAPNASLNIHEQTVVPTTATGDGTDTPESVTTVSASINVTTGPLISNGAASPIYAADQINIVAAVPTITKTQLNCGVSNNCGIDTSNQALDPQYQNALQVRPCEYVRYVILVSNGGQAPLIAPVIRDTLPEYLTNIQYYSNENTVYTVGSTSSSSPIPVASNQQLTAGLDINNDGKTDALDLLPVERNFDLIIQGQVACGD